MYLLLVLLPASIVVALSALDMDAFVTYLRS
jgi:hypothetical protein